MSTAPALVLASLRSHEAWTILTAACCAVACAIPGCFLLLRRLSLLGDAIAHSVLAGIAAGFLLSGTRDVPVMVAGALVAGLATAVATTALNRFGRVPEDAAMGIVFTTLFAVGVLLIAVAPSVDLDPDCVLYGLLDTVGLDTHAVAGLELEVPRSLAWLAGLMAVNILLAAVFFKELRIVAFDPQLATAMGFSAALVHYATMGVVSATAVASFQAVGAILAVAMFIAPPATAHLLTDRLGRLVMLSAISAAISAVAGCTLAITWDLPMAGMITILAGAQFGAACLLAPRHGLCAKALRQAELSLRIAREDGLAALLLHHPDPASAAAHGAPPANGWRAALARHQLRRRGLVVRDPGDTLRLTPRGRAEAERIARAFGAWEGFLADELRLPEDHLQRPAHDMEHYLTPPLLSALEQERAERP